VVRYFGSIKERRRIGFRFRPPLRQADATSCCKRFRSYELSSG